MGSSIIQERFADIDEKNIEDVIEHTKEEVMLLLKQAMRPEFLNRIDDIIMFHPLLKKEIRSIIKIQLQHLIQQLAEQQINISFTDYAIDYLAERGFDPQYGARPLKRIIQKDIINELSKKIIAGAIDKSKLLLIDVFDHIIVFRNDSK
ncbi:MAG: type VI secretion system ATPase TssH, partial [Bacteroidota bacterium]|jgi:ATP-dependent Clp protease ATP-binding subunit ClpB